MAVVAGYKLRVSGLEERSKKQEERGRRKEFVFLEEFLYIKKPLLVWQRLGCGIGL